MELQNNIYILIIVSLVLHPILDTKANWMKNVTCNVTVLDLTKNLGQVWGSKMTKKIGRHLCMFHYLNNGIFLTYCVALVCKFSFDITPTTTDGATNIFLFWERWEISNR